MKVSLNTITGLVGRELPAVAEIVERINLQLGQVETVTDLSKIYKDVLIVKVVTCDKHPDADRLSVCLVDDGGVVKDVERNDEGYVQVVCGAPNVRAGMLAAWLPPKSVVPASYDEAEPFILEPRPLRGVVSNGMLAAADELGLGSDHSGLLELRDDETPVSFVGKLAAGLKFAEVYGLNDTVIDIENKMFTHRPDLFGQIGVAREIAGIFGYKFSSPDWYRGAKEFTESKSLELEVFNDASIKVPRFMAVALDNVEVKQSPLWLRAELVRLGGKPINNIVDATNYLMLMTAQPTHAYDYDRLRGAKLGVRLAKLGETVKLLNGKEYELSEEDIVIVDGDGAVGLGGVMGGGNSEVSDDTKRIVLEVATFDMYAIRKTSMRHGLFTDAVTRFNKGQSPLQNDVVISHLLELVGRLSGATQASSVYDEKAKGSFRRPMSGAEEVTVDFVNARLGTDLSGNDMVGLLKNVEFDSFVMTGQKEKTLSYWAPYWRMDIEQPEDVVEEIGRLYGFEKLPRELPKRTITPARRNSRRIIKRQAREVLKRAGANEVLTYSFVHEKLLDRAMQDPSNAYRLSNALSPDLHFYRLALLPSLLDKVHPNIKAGYDEFALYEIGKAHSKLMGADDEGLPTERELIDIVLARKQRADGVAYFQIKRVVDYLLSSFGIEAQYLPVTKARDDDTWKPFDLSRSAVIETKDGTYVGIVGEFSSSVRSDFKLPEYVAGASLSVEAIEGVSRANESAYRPLPRYPSITQDISLKMSADAPYGRLAEVVEEVISKQSDDIETTVEPLAIYQSKGSMDQKSITLHLTFRSVSRTLTDGDVNPILDSIAEAASIALHAERI